MDNIIDINSKGLTIIAGKLRSGKTTKMIDILNNAIEQEIPTVLVSLELSKEEVLNLIPSNNEVFIYDRQFMSYIERIADRCRQLKSMVNVKLVLIDGITSLRSREHYIMGSADIKSIIIQKLKTLSDELDITIIATALTDFDRQQFDENPIGALDFFCKSEKVREYVDKIVLLEGEAHGNSI